MTAHTVLLVDDTPDVRALVKRALERSGGLEVVAEAGDGESGVDAAREHQPDVVLLDIAMPVMDGLEALPLIRKAAPGATIIMLSGFGADRMLDTAVDAGAAGYIQKGQPMRELVERVHQLIGRAPESGGGTGGSGVFLFFRKAFSAPRPRAQVWCTYESS